MNLQKFFEIMSPGDFRYFRGAELVEDVVPERKTIREYWFEGPVRGKLEELRKAKFTDEEIIYGLRIGLGQARGKKQQIYDREGLVVLKYQAKAGYKQETGKNIRQAVYSAAELALQISELLTDLDALKKAKKGTQQYALAEALIYHFKIDMEIDPKNVATTHRVATIQRNFSKVYHGLSGPVCIADVDHTLSYAGYVPVRTEADYEKAHGPDLLSPFASKGKGLIPEDLKPFASKGKGLITEKTKQDIASIPQQDIVATSIHVDYTLFGEEKRKAELVTFGNDEEGQKRMAEHMAWAKLFCNADVRQILIVHEATHKFCFTADYCYCQLKNQHKYNKLTPPLRLKNADSYAFLALSVVKNKLIKVREDV